LINAFGAAGSMKAVQDDGASHYITYSNNEGRTTSFNGLDYIASYGDLIHALGANNFYHGPLPPTSPGLYGQNQAPGLPYKGHHPAELRLFELGDNPALRELGI
jgi:hypothetical protein